MKHHRHAFRLLSLLAFTTILGAGARVLAQTITTDQERPAFSREEVERAKRGEPQTAAAAALPPLACRGPIVGVTDVGDERLRFTSANYFAMPGGGEGGGYDKTPVLSTRVSLTTGCLNAHLSAIVGSRQSYGVAPLTMFQVTLTPVGPAGPGAPRHMVGHYERPFGMASPAIALEAERDVDMLGANFFEMVGKGPHQVPPGVYRVDVWWSGAGAGGAIGAAFVLKLYQR